jgi:hypothetical protein
MSTAAWGSTLPTVESESVSSVTATEATLEAEVNLHETGNGAYYQFQIVKDPSEYEQEILCPSTRPQTFDGCVGPQEPGAPPIGYLPGNTMQPGATLHASLDLASAGIALTPATTYHYRVLVARRVVTEDTIQWEPPTVYGLDRAFTTLRTDKAPLIEGLSVANLTSTDATIAAQVDTEGLETTYEFKLWASPCSECELIQNIPLPAGKLLGSFASQMVSLDLNSASVRLIPGYYYSYSLIATNAEGKTEARWQSFTAPEEVAPPGNETQGGGFPPGKPEPVSDSGPPPGKAHVPPPVRARRYRPSQCPSVGSPRSRRLRRRSLHRAVPARCARRRRRHRRH